MGSADNIGRQTSVDFTDALPDHPLDEQDVRALDGSDGLAYCRPVAALNDTAPDKVVAAYIGHGQGTYGVVYNPTIEEWQVEQRVSAPHAFDTLSLDQRLVEPAAEQYGDVVSHLRPGIQPDEVAESLTGILPNRPVTGSEVWLIEDRVVNVLGTMALAVTDDAPAIPESEEEGVVVMYVAARTLKGDHGTMLYAGFDPADMEWAVIETAPFDVNASSDDLDGEAMIDWVIDRYDPNVVDFIDHSQ